MSEKNDKKLTRWAQFRFSVIGGLLARPPKPGQLGRELQTLASRDYLHPTKNEQVRFGASTIERWYYQALRTQDPLKALGRKIRSDAGRSKAMDGRLLVILQKQYEQYPHWSYQLHADNLAARIREQPELGDAPSYSTVARQMKEKGWYKKSKSPQQQNEGQRQAQERLEKREVRSYESEYVHQLWHLDFHEGRRVIDVNGKWHTPKVLCILDDHSRLCCHIQWYLNETAEALIHGLKQAFYKRGLPRSLMSDNGSAMIATETQNGLLRLGITHEKTLPYSPYQNGKQETFWTQLEGRLMAMLCQVKPLTLQFLNQASQAWVELEYNRCVHEGISLPPLDRMLQGGNVSRPALDPESMSFAFTVKERRKQRRSDGTVSIKGVRFEIPSSFRRFERLWVAYQSWDLSLAYLVDHKTADLICRIYPQDKIKNSQGYRRAIEPESRDSEIVVPTSEDPIPPLLRKLLADYAATGVPAGYLPMEEKTIPEKPEEKDHEQ